MAVVVNRGFRGLGETVQNTSRGVPASINAAHSSRTRASSELHKGGTAALKPADVTVSRRGRRCHGLVEAGAYLLVPVGVGTQRGGNAPVKKALQGLLGRVDLADGFKEPRRAHFDGDTGLFGRPGDLVVQLVEGEGGPVAKLFDEIGMGQGVEKTRAGGHDQVPEVLAVGFVHIRFGPAYIGRRVDSPRTV